MSKTSNFLSTNGIETTLMANQEIIPNPPDEWTSGYKLKKLSFYNHTKCTIVINGESTIQLAEFRGFEIGYDDVDVESFVILEANTPYEYIGAY